MVKIEEPKRIEGKRGSTLCYTFTPEVTEIQVSPGGIQLKITAFRLYTPEGNLSEKNIKYIEVPAIEEEIFREEIEKEFFLIIKKEGVYLIERYLGLPETVPEAEIKGLEGDIVLWGVIPVEGEILIGYKEVYDGG
jgi:hypothetical protein